MHRSAGAVILLAWLAIAACTSSAAPVTSRSDSSGAVSPEQLVDQAMDEVASASAAHIWGQFSREGEAFRINLHVGTTDGDGRIRLRGYDIRVRTVSGETYILSNDAYLKLLLVPRLRAKASGKWLHFPQAYVQAHLTSITDMISMSFWQTQIPKFIEGNSYEDGGPKVARGVGVSSVLEPETSTFLYVPQTGTPFPVGLSSNPRYLHLNFDAWNQPVTVSTPPERQTVDFTR
jgi:hypothetical protein